MADESIESSAASEPSDDELSPQDFIVFDPRALTFEQIRRLAPTRATVFSSSLIKLLRLRILPSFALRHPPILDELPRELLPTWTAGAFERELPTWRALGFQPGPALSIRAIGVFSVCLQCLCGPEGRLSATLVALESGRAPQGERRLSACCWVTDSADHRYGATTARILLRGCEQDHLDHLPDADAETLVRHVRDRHGARPALVRITVDELGERVREFEARETAALVSRGVYRPMLQRDAEVLAQTGYTLHDGPALSACRRCGGFEPSFRRPGNDGVCDACVDKQEEARNEAVRSMGRRSLLGLLGCVALVGPVVLGALGMSRYGAGPTLAWLLGITLFMLLAVGLSSIVTTIVRALGARLRRRKGSGPPDRPG